MIEATLQKFEALLARLAEQVEALEAAAELQPEHSAISPKEAAKRLDVSPRTFRRMVREGQILPVPIGGKMRVPLSEMRRLTTPQVVVLEEERPRLLAKRTPSPTEEAAKIRAALKRS